MSTPSIIARTAPIAIASKKSDTAKTSPIATGKEKVKPNMNSGISVDPPVKSRSRKDRPCDACRRRKSKCVMHEGQTSCQLCQFHKQDCTFVQSPQPRKRKLNIEVKEDLPAKRR